MRDVLTALKAKFDIVLVDSPPLLPVTDPVILAQESDATLVVLAAGQTKKGQLEHAMDQLLSVNAKRLGIVLNGVTRQGGYGTGYGYEYGYSYRYAPSGAGTNGSTKPASNGKTTSSRRAKH